MSFVSGNRESIQDYKVSCQDIGIYNIVKGIKIGQIFFLITVF